MALSTTKNSVNVNMMHNLKVIKPTKKQIKELEKQFGKHNFCHQCGNPDIVPIEDQHLFPGFCECPRCGSSDLMG